MVANLIKHLLVLFVFLSVMKNSKRQFAIAKSVHNAEVGSPSIGGLQQVEDWVANRDFPTPQELEEHENCTRMGKFCVRSSSCCSKRCGGFWYPFCT